MKHTTSLFWPFILVAVGALWLLQNFGVIPTSSLWALVSLWPVLLIGLGIGLILRSRWPIAWNVIAFLTIAAMVLGVIFAPQLGLSGEKWPWSRGVVASGESVTQERQVSGFDQVAISLPADVTIVQGETESLEIRADKNVIDEIESRVSGNTLRLELHSGLRWFNWPGQVEVKLTVKDLNSLKFSGAGEVRMDSLETSSLEAILSGAGNLKIGQLTADTFTCTLSGTGKIDASGNVKEQTIRISGLGDYNGADLKSDSAEVSISGAGNAEVWAVETLDAHISGAGSVDYYGSPQVTKTISGAGNVSGKGDK